MAKPIPTRAAKTASPVSDVEYRISRTPQGWIVERATAEASIGARVGGPFLQRIEAIDWIQTDGQNSESRDHKAATQSRTKPLSDKALAKALAAAIKTPPPAPRGRPPADDSHEVRIAIEYYWRNRQRKNPTRIIAAIAKEHGCTTDFVRKCRKEYAAVGHWDDDLLSQLRAQSLVVAPTGTRKARAPAKLTNARDYLRQLLMRGSLPATEIYSRSQFAGFSKETVDRAKKAIGVISLRRGKGWVWHLPSRASKA